MEIDSLVISLGLDPSKLRQGLAQALTMLQQTMPQAAEFLQGLVAGMAEALNEAGDAVRQRAAETGTAARRTGEQFAEAGRQGSRSMRELAVATQQVTAKARQAGGEMQTLGRKWGGFLGGMAARLAAPLAGALSAGAVVGGYMRDVAQTAQMTGRYTTQMEEWRKKRELLSRITHEDVELYRKGKLALLDFNFAMASLSATIMRALSPAIQGGIRLLHAVADWVRRNEPNIIRFAAVLAGTITAVLVPAFGKLALAMWANPLTWIIAGILLLAFVIDDLVTYIRGGESAFADLWSRFGTGEEILEKLRSVWDAVLDGFQAMKPYIPSLLGMAAGIGAVAAAFKLWKGSTGIVSGVTGAVRALGAAVAANPIGAMIMLLAAVSGAVLPLIIEHWDEIKTAFGEAGDWIKAKWNGIFTWFGDKIDWVLSQWQKVKGFFGFDDAASELSTALGDSFMIPPVGAIGPQLTAAGVSATTNNARTVTTETNVGQINITTQATDAEGIARDARDAVDRQFAAYNFQTANAGVRY